MSKRTSHLRLQLKNRGERLVHGYETVKRKTTRKRRKSTRKKR